MTNGELLIDTIESVMGVEFDKSFKWRELNSHDVVIAFAGSWWIKERGMNTKEAIKWLKQCANTDCDECEHDEKPIEYCSSVMAECVTVIEDALMEKENGE